LAFHKATLSSIFNHILCIISGEEKWWIEQAKIEERGSIHLWIHRTQNLTLDMKLNGGAKISKKKKTLDKTFVGAKNK
jgi:hypothetical protein